MKELTVAIVGIDFVNADRARTNRRSELTLLDIGALLELRPEPGNRHDSRAVAVFSPNGVQVGYLTAERAPLVGARIRAGVETVAVYQGLGGQAGYARVRFGGGAPVLPRGGDVVAGSSVVDDEPVFYADPDGPEWGA